MIRQAKLFSLANFETGPAISWSERGGETSDRIGGVTRYQCTHLPARVPFSSLLGELFSGLLCG